MSTDMTFGLFSMMYLRMSAEINRSYKDSSPADFSVSHIRFQDFN